MSSCVCVCVCVCACVCGQVDSHLKIAIIYFFRRSASQSTLTNMTQVRTMSCRHQHRVILRKRARSIEYIIVYMECDSRADIVNIRTEPKLMDKIQKKNKSIDEL